MDDLALVDVLERHGNLDEPVEDLLLAELLTFCRLPLDVVGQITDCYCKKLIRNVFKRRLTLAVAHDDDEGVVAEETLFISDNVGMVQVLQQTCFHHAASLLFIAQALENDFLRHILFILTRVIDEPGRT